MEEENPIELGWERLLDLEQACSNGAKLCGVDLNQLASLGSFLRIYLLNRPLIFWLVDLT